MAVSDDRRPDDPVSESRWSGGALLDGGAVLVTGAGSGIGAETALTVTRAGAAVAVNDLVAERAYETCDRIARSGGVAYAVPGDVADPDQSADVVGRAVTALGGLSGLVNNVGVVRPGALETVSLEDWNATLQIDLTSVLLTSRAALAALRASTGAVVNISSLVATCAAPGSGSYSAAKAGVVALTQQMALEWARSGIRVNAVGPGLVFGTRFSASSSDPAVRARRQHVAPLGRTGTPEDIAPVVVFLLSDLARYVTGQFLAVDGGLGIAVQTFIPA